MIERVSRRRFLRRSAYGGLAASAAAIFGANARGAESGDKKPSYLTHQMREAPEQEEGAAEMKLGLVTYLMGANMGLEELITVCERTGFDGLELRTTHAHGVEPTLTEDQRRAVRERFEKTPVQLVCLGSACEYDSPDADKLRENTETTRDFVLLARDVGARAVKVRPNHLHEDEGIPVQQTLEQIGNTLRECGDFAKENDVELWLEIHGPGTSHVPHIRTMMDICNHPSVGVTWNCNGSDIVNGSIRENYLLVRQWIRCLHIHDLYDKGYPYKELFSLLRHDNFDGWANQEMAGSSDPERVMHYYRALFDYMVAEASA